MLRCHQDAFKVITEVIADRVGPAGEQNVPLGEIVERLALGEVFILRGCLRALGYFDPIKAIIHRVLSEITDVKRADMVMASGVEQLHLFVNSKELTLIAKELQAELGTIVMLMVKRVAREILGVKGDAYAEESRNLRIFVPHDKWMEGRADYMEFERERQRGKLTLHGPHTDTWGYHPLNAINLWTAIGPVLQDNGMSLWPGVFGRIPIQGEPHMVRADQVLGRPFGVALNAGDALLFHIGHIHGSRINQTDQTRFVCSARFTAGPPRLSGKPWYSYMHLDGIPERIGAVEPPCASDRVLPAVPPSDIDTSGNLLALLPAWEGAEPGTLVFDADAIAVGEIRPLTPELCAARTEEGVFVLERFCPHEGHDLVAGYIDQGRIRCPWHNLAIDLKTGQSPCRTLRAITVAPTVVTGKLVKVARV